MRNTHCAWSSLVSQHWKHVRVAMVTCPDPCRLHPPVAACHSSERSWGACHHHHSPQPLGLTKAFQCMCRALVLSTPSRPFPPPSLSLVVVCLMGPRCAPDTGLWCASGCQDTASKQAVTALFTWTSDQTCAFACSHARKARAVWSMQKREACRAVDCRLVAVRTHLHPLLTRLLEMSIFVPCDCAISTARGEQYVDTSVCRGVAGTCRNYKCRLVRSLVLQKNCIKCYQVYFAVLDARCSRGSGYSSQ